MASSTRPTTAHAAQHRPPPHLTAPAADGSVAILLATVACDAHRPTALMRWQRTTILGRLLDQLHDLGVSRAHVITRPGWERRIARTLDGSATSLDIHPSSDLSGDLDAIARIARAGSGPLVVIDADVVTHRQALAGL